MRKVALLCVMCLLLSGCTIKITFGTPDYVQIYSDDTALAGEDEIDGTDKQFIHNEKKGYYFGNWEELNSHEVMFAFTSDGSKTLKITKLDICARSGTGKVKIVFIDPDNNVTTLLEYERGADGERSGEYYERLPGSMEIPLPEGDSRVKVAGYDCEYDTVEMNFEK